MYKIKLWDEDKWNIHSSSYNSSKYSNVSSTDKDKKENKLYNEQKYGSREKNVSSDYLRKQDEKEKEEKEKSTSHFDELVEEEKKEEQQKIEEEDAPFKAAKQIFDQKRFGAKKPEPKKEEKTIEEAIKKAIEEEKKVIIMDN